MDDEDGDLGFFAEDVFVEAVDVELADGFGFGVVVVKLGSEVFRVEDLDEVVGVGQAVDSGVADAGFFFRAVFPPVFGAPAVDGGRGGRDAVRVAGEDHLLQGGIGRLVLEEGNPEMAPVEAQRAAFLVVAGAECDEEVIDRSDGFQLHDSVFGRVVRLRLD